MGITSFRLGIETILDQDPAWLRQASLGLVCNQASVDSCLVSSPDRLLRVGARLKKLFGPQHGVRGEKQDNMVESGDGVDAETGLPVYSLYGKVRQPTTGMLEGLDVLLVDLQDVGTRVYTFVMTMAACMRAAREAGVRVVVLDRPNPIGGLEVEGTVLRPECASFVGAFPISMRHGMTMGELAGMFRGAFGLECDLEVIAMEGWNRGMLWADLGIAWVPPSPNMPSPETALVYPGSVLFEGTNLSEGRGTTRPFEFIGAPFVDPHALIDCAAEYDLPGVIFRRAYFEPTFHKWRGELCGGIQIHPRDAAAFQPYRTGLVLLEATARLYGGEFQWRKPPYEYEYNRMPIDLISGSDQLREAIAQRRSVSSLWESHQPETEEFIKLRREYLIYDK